MSDKDFEALRMCVDQVSTSMEAAGDEFIKTTEKPLELANAVLKKYLVARHKQNKLQRSKT